MVGWLVGWLDVSRAGTFSKLEIAGVLRQFNAPTIDGTIFLSQPFPLASPIACIVVRGNVRNSSSPCSFASCI